MSDYTDIVGSFEAEEGYPAEPWIDAFNALHITAFNPQEAADFLVNRLPELKKSISCMSVEIAEGKDRWTNAPLTLVEYHTGGWSGAEDLIEAMLGQFWIRHYHTTWHRGGHFYFEVPDSALPSRRQEGV